MHGDERRLAVGHLDRPPALARDGDRAAQHRARRGAAHRHHQLRPQPHQFDVEPETAGLDLRGLGRLVDAPLAARLELEVLHRIGDVDGAPVDAGLLHRAIHDLPGRPDERTADHVLLVARLLADEQHAWRAPDPRRTPSASPARKDGSGGSRRLRASPPAAVHRHAAAAPPDRAAGDRAAAAPHRAASASGMAVPTRALAQQARVMRLPP